MVLPTYSQLLALALALHLQVLLPSWTLSLGTPNSVPCSQLMVFTHQIFFFVCVPQFHEWYHSVPFTQANALSKTCPRYLLVTYRLLYENVDAPCRERKTRSLPSRSSQSSGGGRHASPRGRNSRTHVVDPSMAGQGGKGGQTFTLPRQGLLEEGALRHMN